MTTSFKRFRALGFRDKANDYTTSLRSTSIRENHRREAQLAEKQNRDNTSALLELRDIEDELNTLKTLFENQMTEIINMKMGFEKRGLGTKGNGVGFLREAERRLEDYLMHVEKMVESVRITRDDVSLILSGFVLGFVLGNFWG